MRIYEFAEDFVNKEASALMTILQYLEQKTKPGTAIPIANVTRLMNNAGFNFSYDNLEELMNSFPPLAQYIADFNADSITIGEKSVADDESYDSSSSEMGSSMGSGVDNDLKTVDKMAKSASKLT